MFDKDLIKHHIDRHILSVLLRQKYARFRDMRPPKVDTNLYSYHLKTMVTGGLVEKTEKGYTLSPIGLSYVDRVNAEKVQIRSQPKIVNMLLVQDGYGKVLLQKRTKQPFIDTWTLPYGKIHIDDESVISAASRESTEKLNYLPEKIRHVGDCYIRTHIDSDILTTTLAHICRFESDDIKATDELMWCKPLDLPKLKLAPAVEQIVARSFFGDDFFFEEFNV